MIVSSESCDGREMEAEMSEHLGYDKHDGYQLFTIPGDRSARLRSTAEARATLGWTPTFPRH
jgi:hypothetical protein